MKLGKAHRANTNHVKFKQYITKQAFGDSYRYISNALAQLFTATMSNGGWMITLTLLLHETDDTVDPREL